jgi:hypothetical protein
LAEYIGRRTVTCEPRDRDRYGRLVATCRVVGGTSISGWMVREGWAVAYRRYSQDFVADEAAARAAKRGIWRSAFINPVAVARPAASGRWRSCPTLGEFFLNVIGIPSKRMRYQGQHQFEGRAHLPRARRPLLREHAD